MSDAVEPLRSPRVQWQTNGVYLERYFRIVCDHRLKVFMMKKQGPA